MREIAPSTALRRWYQHAPERFEEFRERYRTELRSHPTELAALADLARVRPVTLLFAARDGPRSNAAVLGELLTEALG